MASSASFRYGGNCNLLDRRLGNVRTPSNQGSRSCSLMIRNNGADSSICGRGSRIISAAMTMKRDTRSQAVPVVRLESDDVERSGGVCRGRGGAEAVEYEKLDAWMRESVVEIVKNLRKAPLMVHVYSEDGVGGARNDGVSARIVMEKAVTEEDWDLARGKWEAGESPKPEGLIFVEELEERQQAEENDKKKAEAEADGVTRAWGLVIQGKGAECPPACYLLKTSTAMAGGSGFGLGMGCTHFCLVRVNGFWETAESQLRNCWLLQAQAHNKAQGL